MVLVNSEGLIINQKSIGDLDRLVTVLTLDEGLIRAFVKGAKSLKSKNAAATQLFCYSRLLIYKGRDKYIINEAELKEMFFDLRADVEKLSLAQYFCELIMAINPGSTDSKPILKLILNALYFLSKGKINHKLLKPIVEMRLMSICGFMPNLVCCDNCGDYEADIMMFEPNKGTICCKKCAVKSKDISFSLHKGTITAMRHTIYADIKKLFYFKISNDNIDEFSTVAENYVKIKLERNFKTLDFYHQICG